MTVSVLVPWSPGCPWRERAWDHVQARYAAEHSDWEIVTGTSTTAEFSRSQAILDAARQASGDILVIADADVWCDPAPAAATAETSGWAIPHWLIHRLSPTSTTAVLDGADWRGLPLSTDNPQDRRPYVGHETGTLVVMRRDVLDEVPPDPRFVGWGREDDAWALALRALIGEPWRGDDDLVHLWHPPQARPGRKRANKTNEALHARYRAAARRGPDAVRALIEEATTCAQ